ncbi:hypothetical protein [Natronobeatus ordinarius]|uniref:hypothetical protein n=1 Tax=Natronobeatus ordinarius TaxID=2963433 RepID=UPI0020CF6741|nr:hypothetical protein [Natronobeatus ordinarius]
MMDSTTPSNEAESTENNAETEFDGRIGAKMELAVRLVASGAIPSRNQLAKRVGPHGSTRYGYQTVTRCVHRDLLRVDEEHPESSPTGAGAVVFTDRGRAYLDYVEGQEVM